MKKILFFVSVLLTFSALLLPASGGNDAIGKSAEQIGVDAEKVVDNIEFPSLLVEGDWLSERLDAPNLIILDAGRSFEEYTEGHLPGALYAEDQGYRIKINGIKNMFPGVDRTVSWLNGLGVSNDSAVLIYDPGNSNRGSRLAWTLAYLGHKNLALLNGGWNLWKAEGYETESGNVEPKGGGTFVANVQDRLLATGDQVLESLGKDDTIILDTRSPAEFEGTDIRADRGGHVPGAVLVEWTDNQTDGTYPVVLGPEEIVEYYTSKGITPDKEIITHCQSGMRATLTWLALTLAGYENVSLYDASWLEWANNNKFPVEVN